jgi:hypothetical protein
MSPKSHIQLAPLAQMWNVNQTIHAITHYRDAAAKLLLIIES